MDDSSCWNCGSEVTDAGVCVNDCQGKAKARRQDEADAEQVRHKEMLVRLVTTVCELYLYNCPLVPSQIVDQFLEDEKEAGH